MSCRRGVAAAAMASLSKAGTHRAGPVTMTESRPVRFLLIGFTLAFLGLFVALPILSVFLEAFAKGVGPYFAKLGEPDTLSAIRLTLLTAAIAVPLNIVFGVSAAWLISKYRFPGKNLLITLIDLPFAVSPVVAGIIYVLM